jgi:hypothetical protein
VPKEERALFFILGYAANHVRPCFKASSFRWPRLFFGAMGGTLPGVWVLQRVLLSQVFSEGVFDDLPHHRILKLVIGVDG